MKNVDLAPEEKAVIAAARAALDPTALQRARVRRGLDAKIAAGLTAPLLVSSSALAAVLKVGAGVAVAAALGTGVLYVVVPHPREPLAPPHRPAAASAAAPPPVPAPEPMAVAPPAAVPRPAGTHARSTARRAPAPADLAGELALLTQANAATQAGQVGRARELLGAYDRAYPTGQLTQERVAAGILADCAAGRVEAAQAEARRFAERWPRSPLIARLRGSCAREDLAP